MSRQFPGDTSGSISGCEVVYRAYVVETAASNVVTTRRVRTRHDPGGAERDGVDLVRSICIPYN